MGKIAWILGVPAYKVLKFFPIVFSLLLPFLIFVSYRFMFPDCFSLGLTLLIIYFEGVFFLYKPYEFLPLVFILPWWFYFLDKKGANPVIGGILGGILFATYYYWFLPLFVLLAWEVITEFLKAENFKTFLRRQRDRIILFCVFSLVSLPYWGGYLWDVIKYGGEFLQHKFFSISHLNFVPLPTGVIGSDPLIIGISFFGLFFLLFPRERSKFSSTLFKLLLISYFLYLLGNIGVIFLFPILQYKLNHFLFLILVISFVQGLKELRWDFIKKGILVFSLFIGTFALFRVHRIIWNRFFKQSLKQTPIVVRNDEKKIFGKTVLGLRPEVLDYIPSFLFLHHGVRAAHPSSRINERLAFLYLLQYSSHPDFFVYILKNNRFSPIDYLYYFHSKVFFVRKYYADYPNIYKARLFKVRFTFSQEEIGDKERIVKDVWGKGDLLLPLKEASLPPDLTPMEKFIFVKFGRRKGESIRPTFRLPSMNVYKLGDLLVFFSNNCFSKLKPSPFQVLRFLISRQFRDKEIKKWALTYSIKLSSKGGKVVREKYSLRQSGIIGGTCTGVFEIPAGFNVVEVRED